MQRILTFITKLTHYGLQSLHHRYVNWTTPGPTSLLLLTLTDLSRSKSELVAENTLLRKPLIILHRQLKRPACTRTDRMLLVLLARIVRSWKQAIFIVQEDDEARGGIVRASSSCGDTSPEPLLPHLSSPLRLSP